MLEIGADELKVLGCMIHAESMETIIQETGFQSKVALDIVRSLVHYRYLKAVDANGKGLNMFSPDKLRHVRFMLTAKGFEALQAGK